VQSIDHVTLVVKDLAKSRDFYVQTLGMREVRGRRFVHGAVFRGKTQST